MANIAVSSVFRTDGLALSLPRSLLRNPDLGSESHNSQFRRSKRTDIIRAAAAVSTSTQEKALDSIEVARIPSTDFCKGWTDANGMPAHRITSQFESLVGLIADRSEMHAILALQRDNWNRLFHSTITIASVSAAAASAMNGAAPALGLKVVSIILGMGAAALMALVSKFQPSQLAEEQRHAARFFRRLGANVEATLEVDPRLREDASCYWQRQVGTLHALDEAFPLPLTPIVVQKFPKQVRPSKLSGDLSKPEITHKLSQQEQPQINGWTSSVVEDLKRTAQLLHSSDIPEYVSMASGAKTLNFVLAIVSPLMATASVMLNMAGCSSVAAAFTVGSLFSHTLTHALQMGAVYEVYRNCAGYYADVEKSIEESLRLPVQKREDAAIFSQRICMLLGRTPSVMPIVPVNDSKAGTLF